MNYFQHYLVEEFAEDYQEGRLSRRDALKLITSVTGSMMMATSILAACAPVPGETPTANMPETDTPVALATEAPTSASLSQTQPTRTETVAEATPPSTPPPAPASGTVNPDDPAIKAAGIQFQGEGAMLMGYLAQPSGEGSFPVVMVCHENRGLTDHIQDVTRRLAKAGFVALAVDLLSRQGGTGTVGSENVPGVLGTISSEHPGQFVQDFCSGWKYLKAQSLAQGDRVGMVGFCFGGGVTWQVATKMPELLAAVPFYGPHPPVEDVPNIQAAVLAIYAERDQRINQGIPAIEEAMKQHKKIYEKVIYPNTDHAFHNDTGSRYNPEAAQDAWQRTIDWFTKYLKRP